MSKVKLQLAVWPWRRSSTLESHSSYVKIDPAFIYSNSRWGKEIKYTHEEPKWKAHCDGVESGYIGAWRAEKKEQLILIKANK